LPRKSNICLCKQSFLREKYLYVKKRGAYALDRRHNKRRKIYRKKETDMLGSARMVTLKGMPDPDYYNEKLQKNSERTKNRNN